MEYASFPQSRQTLVTPDERIVLGTKAGLATQTEILRYYLFFKNDICTEIHFYADWVHGSRETVVENPVKISNDYLQFVDKHGDRYDIEFNFTNHPVTRRFLALYNLVRIDAPNNSSGAKMRRSIESGHITQGSEELFSLFQGKFLALRA